MLGTINPQIVRIDSRAVSYPGRNHVVDLKCRVTSNGRRYTPLDFTDATRVLLVFPGTDPLIVVDSTLAPTAITWVGDTITVDLSAYDMPDAVLPSQIIVFDVEHTLGQVLVDDIDLQVHFDFRNINTTGTMPAPTVVVVTEAPIDGEPYARQDGGWVPLPDLVAAVTSVNTQTGDVVLDTDDVGEGASNLYFTDARAADAAPVQSVNTQTGDVTLGVDDVGAEYPLSAGANLSIDRTNPETPVVALVPGPTGIDYIGFDAAAAHAADVGQMAWNATDSTVDIGLGSGTVLQIGQEFLIRGRNTSGSTMVDGTVVYVSGAQGFRPVFTRAQANQSTADKTIGVITADIANNADGFCTVAGLVRNFDTSAWAEGSELWLSETVAGGLTTTKPAPPNNAVRIGQVIRSHATLGQILVRVQIIESIGELHDVSIIAPDAGDALVYDAVNDIWVNAPIAAAGEVNTASNLGTGSGVFAGKVSADLQFKSLVAGSGVTLTATATEIEIVASGAGGAVDSVNGATGVVVLDTDDIDEGVGNLYYTNARAAAAAPVQSVDGQTGSVMLSASYAPNSHVGSTDGHPLATTDDAGFMSASDKTKLNGVATGATANSSDAYLLNRANHIGTQAATTVTVADAGSHFTGTDVETVLQEVGVALASAGAGVAIWDTLATPAISSGALTLDLSEPSLFAVTLNQNVTDLSFTNLPTGKAPAFAVAFTQDATGGRTVAWPANVIGTPPDIGAAAGAVTVVSLAYIGGGNYVISGAIYA